MRCTGVHRTGCGPTVFITATLISACQELIDWSKVTLVALRKGKDPGGAIHGISQGVHAPD